MTAPARGRVARSQDAAWKIMPYRRADASDADGNAIADRVRSVETTSYRGSTRELPLSSSGLRVVRCGERYGRDRPPTC